MIIKNDFVSITYDQKWLKNITVYKTKEDGSVDLNEIPECRELGYMGPMPFTYLLTIAEYGIKVKKLILPRNIEVIQESAFLNAEAECLVWPDCCTAIPERAFALSKIKEVQNTENVSEIKPMAFFSSRISSFRVPDKVDTIPANCFSKSSLAEISNTQHLKKIEDYAFSGTSIESFDWPDFCDTVAKYTFLNCEKLCKISNLEKVRNIQDHAFQACGLQTFAWPPFCYAIPNCAFSHCINLESITGLDNVFSIGEYAFRCCKKLKSLDLEKSVCQRIEKGAFSYSALTDFKAGYYLDEIDPLAFYHTPYNKNRTVSA